MNREDPYRDQAERLRKRIEKINESTQDESILPPRSDLHRLKKKKTKWKLKYPIIRILVLFFILLPITIFSIYSYLEGKKHIGAEKASISSEAIDIEKPKKTKEKKANGSNQNNEGKNGAKQQTENNINSTTTVNTGIEAQSTGTNEQTNGTPQQSVSSNNTTNRQDSDKNGSGKDTSTISNSSQDKIINHTVQPQETLFHIAMYYYHSDAGIEIIKQANHIQNNNIAAGQVLKIPLHK